MTPEQTAYYRDRLLAKGWTETEEQRKEFEAWIKEIREQEKQCQSHHG
jgi:hypothetical protein